jgi:cytidyltransferase-like protein
LIQPAASRVLSRAELVRRFGCPREGRLVFTNGVFDLLHAGHLELLERARGFGDVLVVGLNTDASVRRLKGDGRPFQPEGDRALLVAGLRCVDGVTLFDEDSGMNHRKSRDAHRWTSAIPCAAAPAPRWCPHDGSRIAGRSW